MDLNLNIGFTTPLRIEAVQSKPTINGRFTVMVDNLTFSGDNMNQTLQQGHYATVSVEWKDVSGAPAKVDGPTTWQSTDETVLTCAVSPGNPLVANCHAEGIGTATVQATADADMGQGVKTITCALTVDVIQGEAVGGQMNFSDIGSGPPPTPPAGSTPPSGSNRPGSPTGAPKR